MARRPSFTGRPRRRGRPTPTARTTRSRAASRACRSAQGALGFDRWPESNGWGRITEAFNTDPAANVSRAATTCGLATEARLPGCAPLRGALAARTTAHFREAVEYAFHAELHSAIGGAWACRMPGGASLSARDFVAAHPAAAATVENVALNLNLFWRGMFNNSRLNSAYPVLCPRAGACAAAGGRARGHAGSAAATRSAPRSRASRASARARTRGSTPSSRARGARPPGEVAYSALSTSCSSSSPSTRASARASRTSSSRSTTTTAARAATSARGASASSSVDRAADAAPDPSASTGRWRWLDAAGAALPVATDMALTTYVAKLVFHPARVAAYTGPLASRRPALLAEPRDLRAPVGLPARGRRSPTTTARAPPRRSTTRGTSRTRDGAASDGGCWGYALDARLPFSNLFGEDDDVADDDARATTPPRRAAEHVAAVAAELRALVGDESAGGAEPGRAGGSTRTPDAGPGAGPSGGDEGVGSTGGATAHRTYGEQRNAPVSTGGYTNPRTHGAPPAQPRRRRSCADFAWDPSRAGESRRF